MSGRTVARYGEAIHLRPIATGDSEIMSGQSEIIPRQSEITSRTRHHQPDEPQFSASGRYVLSLSEFASDQRYCSGSIGITTPARTKDFCVVAPIQRDGPLLIIEVTTKDALSNHHYDIHVAVMGRSDQHFQVRNGKPITRTEARLADLNSDGFLDTMIVGGTDHRGHEWFKTLLYDKHKSVYRWITDKPNPPDK